MADERRGNLTRLSDMTDYEVADDSPDVRGWDVVGSDGRKIGEVDDLIVDTDLMEAKYLSVGLDRESLGLPEEDRGTHVLVPVDTAGIDQSHNRVTTGVSSTRATNLPRQSTFPPPADYPETFRGHVEPEWRPSQPGEPVGHPTRIGRRRTPPER